MMNIKDMVKNDNKATFAYYRQGTMFYKVNVEEVTYTFPVSLEDIGGATLEAEMKAITLMRYIRKAIEEKTLALNYEIK